MNNCLHVWFSIFCRREFVSGNLKELIRRGSVHCHTQWMQEYGKKFTFSLGRRVRISHQLWISEFVKFLKVLLGLLCLVVSVCRFRIYDFLKLDSMSTAGHVRICTNDQSIGYRSIFASPTPTWSAICLRLISRASKTARCRPSVRKRISRRSFSPSKIIDECYFAILCTMPCRNSWISCLKLYALRNDNFGW